MSRDLAILLIAKLHFSRFFISALHFAGYFHRSTLLYRLVVDDHPNVLTALDFDTCAIKKFLYRHRLLYVQGANIMYQMFPFFISLTAWSTALAVNAM